MSTDRYTSPLSERYASKEMQYIFSQDMKFKTWRKLWIALAETEMELGLSENGKPVITQEQIDELKAHADDINYDVAREREKLVRHDVMSHVYAYGQQCPKAAGIIHLGATSCYVGDNTDIIVMNEALKLVHKKLVNVINELAKFADKYKNLPTLAFTHFQPAQPTTVGKRATLWTQEFIMDLEDLEYVMGSLKLLGSKGTTGTQASFLELFNGDQETIDKIDPMIAAKMGFKECYAVSGQTYSRKVDTRVANILAGIAASAHKMSNDIRLLQHLKEVEEPFEKNQIGSSAMAYKRNPMRSERIASLSRYVMVDALNPAITSATQWFERTLDDSANKRLSIPEGFLAIDGILDLCLNVVDGLVVYDKVITKHMMAELPFMATENIMMDAVKNGGNRQELHEKIRQLSMEAGKNVKENGLDNNLLELIAEDQAFNMSLEDLKKTIDIELKAYHEITDKRGKIIKDANKEAEDIIVEAEESASRIRMSKPNPLYVQRQVKDLNKKDKMALRTANEIYAASIIYTNEMLMEINESVRQAYNMISEETDRVLDSLRQKSDVIEQNKRELMDGLLDMKKQERYADILEISQLLANELYYEKNRFEEEEQKKQAEENEMVQWEFDFEDKKEDPIKVKPSRQPVKLHDDILHDEVVDSAFEIADELKEEKKKSLFEDRTPVPLEESITDAGVAGKAAEGTPKKIPEFRIGGNIHKNLDNEL